MVSNWNAVSKEDDHKLFETIYTKYEKDIFRKIYKILKNQRDAEDVAQETWIYILEHIDIFQQKSDCSIRAYIFSVAKNKSIDLIRKRSKEEKLLCEFDEADRIDESEMFELCAEQSDDAVLQCIMELGGAI